MGDCDAPLASSRASRRASNAGHSAAESFAASSRDRGPGGRETMSGGKFTSREYFVSSAAFCFVELRVGVFDEIGAGFFAVTELRDADRDRDVDVLVLENELRLLHFFAQAFGELV